MAATNGKLVTASWADRSSLGENSNSSNLRFFIVKLAEGNFHSTSPFLIHKCIQSTIGNVKSVKKLRSGDLLVETTSTSQSLKLSVCSTLGHLPVSVSPHSTLNFCRGVISEIDLICTPEEEILEHLRDQNVCGVRRITVRRDGNVSPTKHLILTFNKPMLPACIYAGYLRCPVRPYIPNPLRCFQCQKFGHSKLSCRGTATCARCSEAGHDSETCIKTPICANCKGPHASYSRSCPSWRTEKEIQTVKTEKNIPYPEARKIVLSRTPKLGVSYAAATTAIKSLISVGIQTDPIEPTNRTRVATVNELNEKPKSKTLNKNKNKTGTQTATPGNSSKPPNEQISKSQNSPQSKRSKKVSEHIPVKLTHKDFLKNRTITSEPCKMNTNESLKVYVSPEEDPSGGLPAIGKHGLHNPEVP